MQKKLSVVVVSLFLVVPSCLLRHAEDKTEGLSDAVAGEADARPGFVRQFQISRQDIFASTVKNPVPGVGHGQEDENAEDEVPTGITFATCESSPDEVAVPLNPIKDRTCDVVQGIAYRSDDTGSYEVSVDFVWSIADQGVASFHFMPGHGFDKVQRPQAAMDLFATDSYDQEPETTVTACAIPRDPESQLFEPLCATLSLHNVVNLEGSWCFNGTTFDGDCDAFGFTQDGRFLSLDGSSAQDGSVKIRHVEFVRNGFRYVGSLLSASFMYGVVGYDGSSDLLGTWQASRMPLP